MKPTLSPNGLFFWDGSGWRSLLSADGTKFWDGQAWIPYETPAPAAPDSLAPLPPWKRSAVMAVAAGGVLVLLAVGFVVANSTFKLNAFVQTSGADSVTQLQLEQRYRAAYARDVNRIRLDSVPFAASPGNAGVCNAGGSKQGCFDTDARVVGDMQALLTDLAAAPTPTRYRAADADLREGLTAVIDGFNLRNKAIASGDPNATFAASNTKLQVGLELLRKAESEFPSDARPMPSLL